MLARTNAPLLALWACAALQLLPAGAQAQIPAAATARPDPADPTARVPKALYVSPLRTYQAFAEPQTVPWRDTNDRVRQRGGWRAYAREAREPDTAQPVAPAASQPGPARKPAAGGHAGHEMK